MNRREFIFNALTGLFTVAAAPKFFFDYGANIRRIQPPYLINNSFHKKVWEEQLFNDSLKESYFSKFLGSEVIAVAYSDLELAKKVSAGIKFPRICFDDITLEGSAI